VDAPARLLRRLPPGTGDGKEAALGKAKPRLRKLVDELARTHPNLEDPEARIRAGDVEVDGIVRVNPATRVPDGARIALGTEFVLRGELKLAAALAAFDVDVRGGVALDVGAAAGGFTRVLLRAGARRVYAVDVGHGQLLGSLRQDARVVNLERTNLAELTDEVVPETIDVVTLDLSYLALHVAVAQLERVQLARDAHAIALVKPQFELGLGRPPSDPAPALERARRGFERCGWDICKTIESPFRGARGSTEFLLHARRGSCENP
jgi:23S rRNA (cytidine1920-2'-O)/16S rRNA (cytidine1409-2'-O)-methyltransferase